MPLALVHPDYPERAQAELAVQLGARERGHDCRALASPKRGPHQADVRPASHVTVWLRSRSRQVGVFARSEVQILRAVLYSPTQEKY